jgi:glycosyltransferase involved in cell wall biosynthesis
VPPGDPAALAAAIAEGLGPAMPSRAEFTRAARAHIVNGFSLEVMQRQTLAVYDRLLASNLAGVLQGST